MRCDPTKPSQMTTAGYVAPPGAVHVTASVTPSQIGSSPGVHVTPGGRNIVPCRRLPSSSGKFTSTVWPAA
jgi:hypothetical protein